MIEIVDQSNSDLYSQNQDLINNFTDYSSKNLDFDKPVKVYFMDDEENAKDPLGKTAHYNPDTLEIKIYVTGRHLKDILRSISHELIHHVQNCRGDFGSLDSTEAGYAQSNDHLRGMEQEAYTQGNIMNFRDFEDNYKRGTKTMSEAKINKLKAMVREGVREVIEEQRTDVGLGARYEKSSEPTQKPSAPTTAVDKKTQYVNAIAQRIVSDLDGWVDEAKMNNVVKLLTFADNKGILAAVSQRYINLTKGALKDAIRNVTGVDEPKNQALAILGGETPGAQNPSAPVPTSQAARGGRPRYKKCKTNIQKGCEGDNVEIIQKLLGVNPDRKFWTKTKKAVQAFQRLKGLKPDGIVGEKTMKELEKVRTTQLQESVTINQRKLNEAKSLFDRLKKVI